MTLFCAAALIVGCASFPDAADTFHQQPSLTPNVATVVPPMDEAGAGTPSYPSPDTDDDHGDRTSRSVPSRSPSSVPSSPPTATQPPSQQQGSPSRSTTASAPPADPCAPPELPVVAVCLDAPWGLAPLPDGRSALVAERTTGRIYRVAPQRTPDLVATVDGIDASGSGGLLGIALSPYYVEDHLIYAYVTSATDSRIVRIAPGDGAKAIATGLPRNTARPGGPIVFGPDALLYVAVAGPREGGNDDTKGTDEGSGDDGPPAGTVLRLDAFGRAAGDNSSGTAVFASGLVDPTGICPLPGGRIGVLDHRRAGDVLIPVDDGGDYRSLAAGDALWTYRAGGGGATDCAVTDSALLATSLDGKKVTRIRMTRDGGFTGRPTALLTDQYGRLRTAVTGPGGRVWLTTANRSGGGDAEPSDDRVLILPADAANGGDGGAD